MGKEERYIKNNVNQKAYEPYTKGVYQHICIKVTKGGERINKCMAQETL